MICEDLLRIDYKGFSGFFSKKARDEEHLVIFL